MSLVEKIVEELLRPLKMPDGLLRIGHPKCDLYEHFMEPLFGLCVLSYPISCERKNGKKVDVKRIEYVD
jgi:hypothetical protein